MTQQTKIVLIVVSCMVTGFIAVAVFLPSKDIQIEPIKTDIRRPIPQEGFMINPREHRPSGARKALTIIETHKTHIEGIQGHISHLLLLSGQSQIKRESLAHFESELSGELQKLSEIEIAIRNKSKSPREIKKFMEELRPSMKKIMGDLREELDQQDSEFRPNSF